MADTARAGSTRVARGLLNSVAGPPAKIFAESNECEISFRWGRRQINDYWPRIDPLDKGGGVCDPGARDDISGRHQGFVQQVWCWAEAGARGRKNWFNGREKKKEKKEREIVEL